MDNAIVFFVFALIIYVTIKRHRDGFKLRFSSSSNFRMAIIFVTYLISIIVFAKIYQHTYNSDSRSFVFASEISKTNIEELNKSDSNFIADLKYQKYFCDSVGKLITQKQYPIAYSMPGTYCKTYRYEVGTAFIDFDINELFCHKGITSAEHGICIWDSTKKYYPKEVFISQTIDSIPYDTLIVIRSMLTKRLSQIKSEIQKNAPNIVPKWTYLEFFYFSTITQATVGYGDMLPNSKRVRFLVAVQTLLGVILTVFLIGSSLKEIR